MRFPAITIPPKQAESICRWPLRSGFSVLGPLNPDHLYQLRYGVCALLQGRLLVRREFDFDDLLQAVCAELARHADKEPLNAVLALKMDGTGQDLFLVLEDGFHHLRSRRGRSIVSAAGFQVFDNLSAAVAGALDDGVEPVFGNQFGDRNPGDG